MDKKRPSGEQNLVAWARPYLADKRKVYQLVDPRLELNYSLKGVQKVSQLSYNCLSRDPKSRPSMDEVVKVLSPLQDLNDLAILSHHARLSQPGRRKKKPDGSHQMVEPSDLDKQTGETGDSSARKPAAKRAKKLKMMGKAIKTHVESDIGAAQSEIVFYHHLRKSVFGLNLTNIASVLSLLPQISSEFCRTSFHILL
ncbi:hypothetical protein RHMOL_Rhmol03G0275900 [Rhododendron molle]|uniref:Uncharacterized protein n=1 Tax=Rhododendron molle TaxID=49168 RepID=A0ACC0PKG0_RHOML|nr:hypothetical protein RHMOL_Rhmol03G0275900 [Rhododendron molle]